MLLRACGVDLSMELTAYDVSRRCGARAQPAAHGRRAAGAGRGGVAPAGRSPEQAADGSASTRSSSRGSCRRSCSRSSTRAGSSTSRSARSARSCMARACSATTSTSCPRRAPPTSSGSRQAYIALNARTPKNKQLRLDPARSRRRSRAMLTRSGPLNIILTPAGTTATTTCAARRPRAARVRGAHDARLARRHHPHHRRPRRQERRSASAATPPPARPRADHRARIRTSSR